MRLAVRDSELLAAVAAVAVLVYVLSRRQDPEHIVIPANEPLKTPARLSFFPGGEMERF